MYSGESINSPCDICQIFKRWKNTGDIKVVEYEWPPKYVMTGIGGIDLILETPDGKQYGAEVKPYYSHETISRMVAEILTYTLDSNDYSPAIAVFEKNIEENKESDQYKAIKNLDLVRRSLDEEKNRA